MAVIVSKRKEVTKPFSVTLDDGEVVAGTYRPALLTFEFDREMRLMYKEDESEKGLCEKLVQVVASWDVEGEPGEPLPLTVDALMDVPSDIMFAVIRGVRSAGGPPAPTPPATSASFS